MIEFFYEYNKTIIATNKPLDEHLKRHLNLYMKNKKPLSDIHKWLTNKGYKVVIK